MKVKIDFSYYSTNSYVKRIKKITLKLSNVSHAIKFVKYMFRLNQY